MKTTLIALVLSTALCGSATAMSGHSEGGGGFRGMNCDELYVRRNSFYKEKGLCFTHPVAVRRFGNRGCTIDSPRDLDMSRSDRAYVQRILDAESDRGCGRHGSEGYE